MTETLAANHWARAERSALCDLFDEAGPDAPTLCEGWRTRDLAAHLVVREGRVDASLGIMLPPLAGYTAKVQSRYAAKPWTELVAAVRNGPPKWSMMRAEKVDGAANTIEFFVHHEDVRRAAPGWEPRVLDAGFEQALAERLASFAPRLMKSTPVPLVLEVVDGPRITVREGAVPVVVRGPAGELTMLAYGRSEYRVEISGPEQAADAVRNATFGI
jgi:uncharacterized protein (TIGR03085 family)